MIGGSDFYYNPDEVRVSFKNLSSIKGSDYTDLNHGSIGKCCLNNCSLCTDDTSFSDLRDRYDTNFDRNITRFELFSSKLKGFIRRSSITCFM